MENAYSAHYLDFSDLISAVGGQEWDYRLKTEYCV